MKQIHILSTILLIAIVALTGCEKDNFKAPTTWMTGRLVHNGEPFQMDGSPSDANDEIIQFFQEGFGKHEGWGIRVKYDGSYSSLLFDGEYKLMPKMTVTYPWEWTGWPQHVDDTGKTVLDTIVFVMKGDYVVPDIEITPYYGIGDVETQVGTVSVSASFTLREMFPGMQDLEVENAYLYLGPTQLVNSNTPIRQEAGKDKVVIGERMTISMPVSKYTNGYINNRRNFAYGRIAVKTSKSDRMLWSPVVRIDNLPTDLNDVSEKYLTNYQAPYAVAAGCPPSDSYSTPAGWYVSSECKILTASDPKTYPELQGCLELRFGRNCIGAISYDTNPQAAIVDGKMSQTITLPAGRYLFSATPYDVFVPLWGGNNTCHIIVAKGKQLPGKGDLASAIGYSDTIVDASVIFTLDAETEITLGFLFNFPDTEPLAVGFTKTSLIDLGQAAE